MSEIFGAPEYIAEQDGKRRISLFILEDNPEDIALYKRRLDRQNEYVFDISTAASIAEAKKICADTDYDCYVVDFRLPDGEGLDFIYYLTQDRGMATPGAILMITGQGNEEIAVEAMKSGVHDYLTKRSISEGFFVRPLLNAIQRAELSSQILYYQRELERSNQELSDFTHTASHDLKAPLRRIISYCEMLEEDAVERLNDEEKAMLKRMSLNASRMQTLISDLLMFSQIQSQKEEAVETDVKKLVSEIVEELADPLSQHEAQVELGVLPTQTIYPVRVRQLFANLLSNALKYKSAQPPRISIRYEQGDKEGFFVVEDNGIGIPKEFLNDIFKDFKRLHNQDEIEGTGLGLSICRKIVEKHQGRIWVESEVGKGSKFCFTLYKPREG
ncbi:MAG: ATP-binding protein [Pseudobdellovibrionaceae bacterium]